MATTLNSGDEAQLMQTVEMFEVISQSQPHDYQSLEILKEAYTKLGREKDVVATSKRIAQAYVELGQLSSAILEYETILQLHPNDAEVQRTLQAIESKAGNISVQPMALDAPTLTATKPAPKTPTSKPAARPIPTDVDDGRDAMHKLFVDSKTISAGDFDLTWTKPDYSTVPKATVDPFIQILNDKGILPVDRSMKILADKSRLAFIPLERYEVDLELTRNFPAEPCRRWCVMPFDRMSKSILVATANPFNKQAARELSEATSLRLIWYLAPPQELLKNLLKAFR